MAAWPFLTRMIPLGLLREMAKENVLVEICVTSNDVILGVGGDRHTTASVWEPRDAGHSSDPTM